MLDIVPSPETRPCTMFPADFSPYLLSASPPNSGFSLGSLSLSANYTPYLFSSPASRPSSPCPRVYGTSCARKTPSLKSIMSVNSSDENAFSADSQTLEESTSTSGPDSSSKSLTPRLKKMKHVSFADDVGKPLAEVRVMLDNPTAPPLLSIRAFPGSVTNGDDSPRPQLVTPDPQPMHRPNFEEELARNLVAVENVLVNRLELTCTILINNRPSSKRVFGRCTMDSWHSFVDVGASFSQVVRPGVERYTFKFNVPSSADRSKSVQFAVCYEADAVQNWDNNDGNNFVVHWNDKADAEDFEDNNANRLNDYGGLVWCSHDELDRPYY